MTKKELNDLKVISFKETIEQKKDLLKKEKVRFTPETNCILKVGETNCNLNLLNDKNSLQLLLIQINTYIMSADNLGIEYPLINGYSIDIWIKDIKNKLEVISYKEKEREIDAMEKKLNQLLSEDKKTELELENIAKTLGL